MYVKLMKRREIGRYGRRGERRYRLARVQRVDQHEIGAGLAVRIDHEGLEVLEITHAPGSGGPDGIQLGHPAPQLVMFHGRQHRNTLGGADQRGVLRAVAHADHAAYGIPSADPRVG